MKFGRLDWNDYKGYFIQFDIRDMICRIGILYPLSGRKLAVHHSTCHFYFQIRILWWTLAVLDKRLLIKDLGVTYWKPKK